jgi:mannose-6-phosphate isomerase
MPAIRLETKRVEKPWGRRDLWQGFDDVPEGGDPIGEVWFQAPEGQDAALLIKYLFTSAKLSIQVHPNDSQARERGYARGKDEAWVILAAEPHATIGLGLREATTKEHLRAAALDGSIEGMMDWRSVRKDDFLYSPADTVHAIGPGLTLIEVQQNVDLTYRLYDYGSDRELHLDDGIAVSDPVPYVAAHQPYELDGGRLILADGPAFVLERWTSAGPVTVRAAERPVWLVPITGGGTIEGARLEAGTTWLARGDVTLDLEPGIDMLVAYPGGDVADDLAAR